MKKGLLATGFTKALGILLSQFGKNPYANPYVDGRWKGLGPRYPDLHKKRGTVNRYAGMHPRRGHPHTQENARRR